ncbi:MAG TPA: hypothetical protein VN951_01800 [Pyrinomonadaceae bacterium]|nr:hypothetical protein [Pyrinomonadaceae bacterium]
MTSLINRRELITGGLKAGVGRVLLDHFSGIARPVFAASTTYPHVTDRFQADHTQGPTARRRFANAGTNRAGRFPSGGPEQLMSIK